MADRSKALTKLPSDFSPIYKCPGCNRLYPSRELAVECSDDTEKPDAVPGDIVRIDIGYGWYDGAKHWMILNTDDFNDKNTHSAYFVITAITAVNHRLQYSVKTLGIKNGNPTGLCGWTRGGTDHQKMFRVKTPDPRIIEESKPFVGEIYEHLL